MHKRVNMFDIAYLFRKIKILGTPDLGIGQQVWIKETERYPRALRFFSYKARVVDYNRLTKSYDLELLEDSHRKNQGEIVNFGRKSIDTLRPTCDG